MILYHGTSKIRGEAILATGIIENNNNNPVFPTGHPLATTPGYVYLTDALELAVKFGIKATVREKYSIGRFISSIKKTVCLFEIHINKNAIEIDADELRTMFPDQAKQLDRLGRAPNLIECLSIFHSVRTSKSLILGKDIKRYLFVEEPYDTKWFILLNRCRQEQNSNYANLLNQISTTLLWQSIDRK